MIHESDAHVQHLSNKFCLYKIEMESNQWNENWWKETRTDHFHHLRYWFDRQRCGVVLELNGSVKSSFMAVINQL